MSNPTEAAMRVARQIFSHVESGDTCSAELFAAIIDREMSTHRTPTDAEVEETWQDLVGKEFKGRRATVSKDGFCNVVRAAIAAYLARTHAQVEATEITTETLEAAHDALIKAWNPNIERLPPLKAIHACLEAGRTTPPTPSTEAIIHYLENEDRENDPDDLHTGRVHRVAAVRKLVGTPSTEAGKL